MEYKKLKLALLFVTILVLVKLLFSNTKNIEWGSVSDWFNTASSIITTYIAYRAYKAAPTWIKQKSIEIGFNHVISLMSEYDEIENEIQKLYIDILMVNSNDSKFSDTWIKVESIAFKVISLQSKLYACERWNIGVLPETYRCFARLRNFCKIAYTMKSCLLINDVGSLEKAQKELEKIKKDITSDSYNFKKNIHDYFQFPQ